MKCIVEIFSRITGFYRPTSDWNPGKKSEFTDRKKFDKDVNKPTDDWKGSVGDLTDDGEYSDAKLDKE